MSEKQNLPPPVEPEWQGQYSYYPQIENEPYHRPFGDARNSLERSRTNPPASTGQHGQGQSYKREIESQEPARHIENSTLRRNQQMASTFGSTNTGLKLDPIGRDALGMEAFAYPRLTDGNSLYRSHTDQVSGTEISQSDRDDKELSLHQDDDLDVEDDDVDDNERDLLSQRQTVAERLAARRKMKRFRLTHQQTRFLMSEFAKQPHPDVTHRERLSREIPGLSPRQVQVWFQNRRAKIKRLTAHDRDRMIRMRAVPDDFDNVQALHSPYGASTYIGTPMSSSNLAAMTNSYGNHGVRPVMVDMRRPGGEAYMSPTGLSHSFGGIDIGHSGAMASSDMVSPSNPIYHDRYVTSSPSAASTPGLGHWTPNAYWGSTPGSMENASQFGRQGLRDSNSVQGRDWNSRHASDMAQTPLSLYGGGTAVSNSTERQMSYPTSNTNSAAGSSFGGYEVQAYSNHAGMASRGTGHSAELEENGSARVRTTSASAPSSLATDFACRDPLRSSRLAPVSGPQRDRPQGLPSLKSDTSPSTARHTPGPLSAPLDMSTPQSFRLQTDKTREYSSSQLSAPITAPSDVHRTFPSPSSNRNTSNGPLKDLFGHGVL